MSMIKRTREPVHGGTTFQYPVVRDEKAEPYPDASARTPPGDPWLAAPGDPRGDFELPADGRACSVPEEACRAERRGLELN